MSETYYLKASQGGLHKQHPDGNTLMRPLLNPNCFEALALLDGGEIDPRLAGHQILCLGFSIGAVNESFIIQEKDGLWSLVNVDGGPPHLPTEGSKYAEPFEDGDATFTDLPNIEPAALARMEDPDDRFELRENHIFLKLGKPEWVQSDRTPKGEDWIFVARIDCYYMTGSVFVFYDPKTRSAHHRIQYT